jgi:hypothetical protein
MKNKLNENQIQQGDVLLRIVAALPTGCVRLKSKRLATGEKTGHHHSFAEDSGVVLMEAPDKTVYAVNEGDADTLIHQEHGPVTLKPGQIADFGQVREKDWFSLMVRPVTD